MDTYKPAFDYVAAEKAIAMRKYRCHQNFKSVLTVCAAVSPLIFALCRSLPSASKLSSVISSQVHAVFDNQLYVFTLVMALLAAIYALARQHDEESARSPDIYEEFAVNRVYCRSVVVNDEDNGGVCSETEKKPSFPETESKANEESKNAVVPFPPVNGRETFTETETHYVPPVITITTESADVALVEKEKRYMTTQSEGFGKKKISSTTRIMRRSETEIYRKNKSCGEEEVARRSGSVEVLDNEEFNRKIQKFIEDMKQTQKEEKRQEEEDERRRRRAEGNYVRMASFTSSVIH
ncbi:hypothetical protein D8674_015455 [Pyrus ussuriensis x Pyrus communis]|uniref:Uncharacterized protein n=1 Tax=Pyrus ussuriensis x Pyrus communis TaxID=2448454 RepID=A0A5N5GVF4_9ROSA|nr:hypothetical protein D8674_015455 [Pyrus ussuriensis x Pyrus communis]